MSGLSLEAKKRETKGKNNAGRLRRAGQIPANLIGDGKSTIMQISTYEFDKMLQAGLRQSQIIKLDLDGEIINVIVKEIQRDPVKNTVKHIDFIRVENGKKALLKIAIETVGIAKGVKMGGALEHFVRSLKIKAVPESFKDNIQVDISNLNVNDSVSLKDLNVPDSWEVLLQGNPVILKIAPSRISKESESAGGDEEAKDAEKTAKVEKPAKTEKS